VTASLRLYGYWRSSCSWRVRAALHWKGLAFAYTPVNLLQGAQRDPAYAAVNPVGQVPVLEVQTAAGVHRLHQSLAILEWLEEAFPTPALLPSDPLARARARGLAELINASIQPMQNLVVLAQIEALGGDKAAFASQFIRRGLAAFEAEVADGISPFAVGDAPSFADLCLVPQLYGARRFGVDLTPYPRLCAIEAACAALPAFAAAHPDRQADAVV
jgi:maleylpyruvate isomerase